MKTSEACTDPVWGGLGSSGRGDVREESAMQPAVGIPVDRISLRVALAVFLSSLALSACDDVVVYPLPVGVDAEAPEPPSDAAVAEAPVSDAGAPDAALSTDAAPLGDAGQTGALDAGPLDASR